MNFTDVTQERTSDLAREARALVNSKGKDYSDWARLREVLDELCFRADRMECEDPLGPIEGIAN